MRKKNCSVVGCAGKYYGRGFCNKHYQRWKIYGDATRSFLRAEHGKPREWLNAHVSHAGDDCLIWPFAHSNGRARIGIEEVSAIMCRLAHGDAPSVGHEAAHSCGKGHERCVNPKHLRWATTKENMADKRIHGTHLYGERVTGARLTENQVREIRVLCKSMPQTIIADQFGIARSTVSAIVTGRNWPHVVTEL